MTRIYETKYIWGDLHFGDNGMWKRTYSKRFDSREAYTDHIIKTHNQTIRDGDVVLFLGDLGRDLEPYKQMKGYKILIKGNHDAYPTDLYGEFFDEVFNYPLFIRPRILASHIPAPTEPGVINIHGHIHDMVLKSDRHVNLCPEQTNYQPIRLQKINNMLGDLTKPRYRFLYEWYKDIQIAPEREDLVRRNDGTIDVAATLAKRGE